MAAVPRPSPDERKAAILDAVLKSIIDVGFTAMTVADVAKVAGVSTALVHYHFSSKTELILAALRRACEDDKQLRESVVAAGGTALARIDRVLCGSLPRDRTDASWLLWIETWGETRREPALRDVMDDLNHHEQRIIGALFADGAAAGEFGQVDAAAATDRLMAARDGLAIQHTLFGAKAKRSHFRDLLRGAIRHQLGLTDERYEDLLATPVRAAG
jgi:AcrR family transcriptional regulator